MHTLFLLSALLLAAAGGAFGMLLLRAAPATGRRPLALVVLLAPPAVLGLATMHLVPHFWPDCAPLVGWDRVASFALLGMCASVGLGAGAVNLARLLLVERLLDACPPLDDAAVSARLTTLAAGLGIAPPALRILHIEAPLAVSGGIRRRTIVLSSWLIERLDPRELEAVLGHELAHLARRDHVTRWLGRLLRDATAYLPGGWYALRALETDEELNADVLAIEATRRPLAMASALGKVWRGVLGSPRPTGMVGVPGYAGASEALLEQRLARLLDGRTRRSPALPGHLLALVGLISIGAVVPHVLAVSAAALPLVCTLPR